MFASFTAIMGRVGWGEVFFLTFFGTFFYELNSQLLWRFFILDSGYPSRAFAFGGALGLVCSLILNQRTLTLHNSNYLSSYYLRTLSLFGAVLLWCCYPVPVSYTHLTLPTIYSV